MRGTFAFPAYLPDQLPRNILTEASNVLPAADGYRPVGAPLVSTPPLPAGFRGGGAFLSSSGAAFLLAGTTNGLERFSGGVWNSLLAAQTVGERWAFAQFGDFVVTVNGVSTKQIDMSSGAASNLVEAPSGTSVAVVGDHVVIGQADGNRLLVRWSSFNRHTGWQAGVDQAGFQPMLDGGDVMGIAGGEYGIILQRFALTRMSLSGDATAPFVFQQVTNNVGCASRASIAQSGRTVFFLSDRGFMALDDGAALRPIGNEKFDQSFHSQVDPSDYERLWAVVDPQRSLVMWGMPGLPGRIWVYNWVLDRASTIDVPFLGIFTGYESSQTLETVAGQFPNADAIPYSLDDPRFRGGGPRVYLVTQANELAALAGAHLEASLTTGWVALAGPRVTRLRGVWPETDAAGGVVVSIAADDRMRDRDASTSQSSMQAGGRVPIRSRGRYMRFTVKHAAGSDWSYTQGFDYEAEAGGTR